MPNSHAAILQTDAELLCDLLPKMQKNKSEQSHSLVSPGKDLFHSTGSGGKVLQQCLNGVSMSHVCWFR